MDVNLPGIDGLEATRRILGADGPPVVLLLSTYEEEEYAPRAAGMRRGRVHPQGGLRPGPPGGGLGSRPVLITPASGASGTRPPTVEPSPGTLRTVKRPSDRIEAVGHALEAGPVACALHRIPTRRRRPRT